MAKKTAVRSTKNSVPLKAGLAAAMALVVVLGAAVVWLVFFRDTGEPEEERNMRGVVVNQENAARVADDLANQQPIRAGHYMTNMTTTWHFKDGSSESQDAYVENAANNTNDVYFDLELADTEEVIYESPLLPLGSYLQGVTLDKPLEAGTWPCVVVYHLVDSEQNTVSTLRVSVEVIVEH